MVRGSELLKQSKLDQAQRAFRAALEIDPDNVRVLALLGLAHFRAGELADARVIYEQLVERMPTDASHRLNLGLVHLKLNDAARAIAALEASRALDPSQGRAVSYLGLAYARGGRYAEAYRSFLIAGQNDLATEIESNLTGTERDRIHHQLGRTPQGPLPPSQAGQAVYTPGPVVTVAHAQGPGASTPTPTGLRTTPAGGARTPTPSGVMRAVAPATGRTPTPTEVAHTLGPAVARTPTPTGIPRTPPPGGSRTPTPTGLRTATPAPTSMPTATPARLPVEVAPAQAATPAPAPTGVPRTKPPSPPPPKRISRELAVATPESPASLPEPPPGPLPEPPPGPLSESHGHEPVPVDTGHTDAAPLPAARAPGRITESTQFVMPHGDPAAPQQMLDGPSMISRAVASASPPVLTGTRTRAGGIAPRPLSELATDELVRPDDGDDAFEIAANGALILRVTERVLTRLDGVHVTGGDLGYEAATRRSRGHHTDEPFDHGGSPLHTVTGRGYLIAVPGRHAFTAVMLDDDILYLREDLVFAFQPSLRWENGNVPGLRGRLPVVQFRGDGALVMRLERPLVRIKLSTQGMVFVDADRLAGWIGRVIPRAVVPPAGGPLGAMCVECTGEGIVLVEPRATEAAPAASPAAVASPPAGLAGSTAPPGALAPPADASAAEPSVQTSGPSAVAELREALETGEPHEAL